MGRVGKLFALGGTRSSRWAVRLTHVRVPRGSKAMHYSYDGINQVGLCEK
jgi:hypothetical protein